MIGVGIYTPNQHISSPELLFTNLSFAELVDYCEFSPTLQFAKVCLNVELDFKEKHMQTLYFMYDTLDTLTVVRVLPTGYVPSHSELLGHVSKTKMLEHRSSPRLAWEVTQGIPSVNNLLAELSLVTLI